jgi:hypothetical protein
MKRSAISSARLCVSALSIELFWPKVQYGIARKMNSAVAAYLFMIAYRASEMPNVALERLAHAT